MPKPTRPTGNIATDYVAQAKPDGYTIFLTSTSGINNQVSNPAVKTNLSKDFDSIFKKSSPSEVNAHILAEMNTWAHITRGVAK